jgi:hypothetical protein
MPRPRATVEKISYPIRCQAIDHAEQAGEEGWHDGVLCTLTLTVGSPPLDMTVFCGACQRAADAGE